VGESVRDAGAKAVGQGTHFSASDHQQARSIMISWRGDVAIKCHKCSKEANSFKVGGITVAEDMHEIRIEGGHGDEFPQDLDVLAFDVCGTCLRNWVNGFAVPTDAEHDQHQQSRRQ
jgi:hypothetical protein